MIAPLVTLQDTRCLHLSVFDILIKCIHFKEKSCFEASIFFLFYASFPFTFEIYMSLDHSVVGGKGISPNSAVGTLYVSAVFNMITLLKK